VEILEKMLEVETQARQIIETAQREADEIRKKARDDAKQLVIDGRKNLQERLHQEITQIEEEAAAQKKTIFQEAETRLVEMEQVAEKQMNRTVDRVINVLLNR
jgi:vacuolar-type H+-ATPase subunit H